MNKKETLREEKATMFLIIWVLSLVGVALLGLGVYGWLLKLEEDGVDFRKKFKIKHS
jgi:hypothetical protein